MLVGLGLSPSLAAKTGVIALTSLLRLIKALTLGWLSWNWLRYQMKCTRFKASKLAITNVEIAETAASFLAQYNRRHNDLFCYNYNRWISETSRIFFFFWPPSLVAVAGATLAPVTARLGLLRCSQQLFFFLSFLAFLEDFSALESCLTWLALSLACKGVAFVLSA